MNRPLLLALLLVVGLGLPTLTYPLGPDQSTFVLIGDGWLHGLIPYRDAWDIKPPGIFLLYGLARAIFGASVSAVHLLDLLWCVGTCLALYALARRVLTERAGVLAVALYGLHYLSQDYWELGQTDAMAVLPGVLAALLLLHASEPERLSREGRLRLVLEGACIGAAIAFAALIKLPAVLLSVGLFAVLLERSKEGASVTPPMGALLLGILLGLTGVPALLTGYFAWTGALTDFLETLFVWAPHYAWQGGSLSLEVLAGGLTLLYRNLWSVPLLLVPALMAVVWESAEGKLRRLLVPLALLLGALAMTAIQAKFYRYHVMALFPPLALLAGHGLALLWGWLETKGTPDPTPQTTPRMTPRMTPRWAVGMALLACMLALPLDLTRPVKAVAWNLRRMSGELNEVAFYHQFTADSSPTSYSFAEDFAAARAISAQTAPTDSIFVWGFEPAIYFLSERRPASRFIYHFPVAARWAPPSWHSTLLEELTQRRPALILVSHKDSGSWMTGRRGNTAELLEAVPELQTLLADEYTLENHWGAFDAYRLKP